MAGQPLDSVLLNGERLHAPTVDVAVFVQRIIWVAERTVINFERGARRPYERTIADIRAALEDAGIDWSVPAR